MISQKKFVSAALDLSKKAFIVYIAYLSSKMIIYSAQKAQIVLLITEKIIILAEYLDYIDVFSKKSAAELPKHSNISKYFINLELSKQSPYRPIYSLGLVKLKIVKTYIKTNLANSFIYPSKSLGGTLILLIQKPNNSLCLYVNYCGLNNLMIKNQYPLSLIGELPN